MDPSWLAARLRQQQLVDEDQLEAAIQADDLCLELVRTGAIEESALLRFLGLQYQTRYITTEKLSQANIPQWVIDLLPVQLCEELKVLPVRCDKQRSVLSIVTPDPSNDAARSAIQRAAGVQQVQAHIALPHAIDAAIKKLYKGDIHAFARLDRLLARNFNEMLETYDGRLIDFDGDQEEPLELAISQPRADRAQMLTGPSQPAIAKPARPPTSSTPAAAAPPVASRPAAPSPTPQGEMRLFPALRALVNVIEMEHGWRRGHSAEVTRLATALAKRLGMGQPEIDDTRLAAVLHEIGKPHDTHLTVLLDDPRLRGLAQQVWLAPLKLLRDAGLPAGSVRIISAQYERLGGDGVPGKLAGEEVPLGARVLAAADLYCELAHNPSYDDSALHQLAAALRLLFDEPTAVVALEALEAAAAAEKSRPQVLIIDADEEAARALEIDLLGAGYDVHSLRTTAEAARSVLSKRVDLIISEVELRPVDGFDFLQRIRADARTQQIPLIFLTGRSETPDIERGLSLGAAEYVTKPYETEHLLSRVQEAVGA